MGLPVLDKWEMVEYKSGRRPDSGRLPVLGLCDASAEEKAVSA